MKKALRESEERYRSLFESIDEGYCIIEVVFDGDQPVDYIFVEVNPAFSAQTGIENAVGRRVREIVPELEEHWFEIYGRIATTGRSERFQAPARTLGRHFDVYAFRLGGPEKRRVAILFRDTTLQHEAEKVLRATNRRQQEFLSVLSHELRNPLGALVQGLALVDADGNLSETSRQTVEMMGRQLEQMVRLVDDLLDVGRIASGKIKLRRTVVALETLVRDALESVGVRPPDRNIQIDLPEERLELLADPARLVQALANLISNACRHSDRGDRIRIQGRRSGDEIVVSVADEGEGIASERLAWIFEPFAQTDPSAGGLGLGLALVKQFVELHGGVVQAESDGPGRGCIFTLRLPMGDVSGGEEPRPTSPETLRLLSETRVLVVDDAQDNADSLAMLLRAAGAEARSAYSGNAALDVAREWMPDAALVDLDLPDLSGHEVAKRLRKELGDRVALIAVTGFGSAEVGEKARRAGFSERLVKPVDPGSLVALIAQYRTQHGAAE